MKGLDLSERFYWEVVSPVITAALPQLVSRCAAGLIGFGSDVLGHDDEQSRDHEWGARCILWLAPEDYAAYADVLDSMLDQQVPSTFYGFPARFRRHPIGYFVPAGDEQHGVHHVGLTTVQRFLQFNPGMQGEQLEPLDWLCIPEQKLLEVTRGRIFHDPVGDITRIRERLAYLPEDIWIFKLLYAWQALDVNADNIRLCASRGDTLSARLAYQRTVEVVIRLVFLLNRAYCPGTVKWVSREFFALPHASERVGTLIERGYSASLDEAAANIESIYEILVQEFNRLGMTETVELTAPSSVRGHFRWSSSAVVQALADRLSPELRELEWGGGIDQWVTNEDILIWANQYTKFKPVYSAQSKESRDQIGDWLI